MNAVSQEVFEQLKIEDMWAGLKAHASKELNKANAYIRLLKVIISTGSCTSHSLLLFTERVQSISKRMYGTVR